MHTRNLVAYFLAAAMAIVLVGFVGLILAGNVIKRLDEDRYAWEIVDAEGDRVTDAQFDEMRAFHNGLAAVRQGDRWGFVDAKGTMVVAPAFKDARDFLAPDRAAVRDPDNVRWGYIDRSGAWVIDPTLYDTWGFSEGLAVVRVSIGLRTSRITSAVPELTAGLLDPDGHWVIAPVQDRKAPNRMVDARDASEGLVAVEIQDKWGFVDLQGHPVIPPTYDRAGDFVGGLAPVATGDRWSFVDRTGATVLSGPWSDACAFSEGLAAVRGPSGWSFVDRSGATVIPGPFENVQPFSEGYAGAEKDKVWGFIDKQGTWVVQPAYRSVEAGVSEGEAIVTRQGAHLETLYVDMAGEERGPFEGALPYSGGVAGVRVDRR